MIARRTIVASYFLMASLLSACAGRHNSSEEAPSSWIPPDKVVLEVENRNWADVVLYIVHDGVQTRVTQVAAAHDLSIEIPAKLQGQMGVIRLAARRIGGTDSFTSREISLRGNPRCGSRSRAASIARPSASGRAAAKIFRDRKTFTPIFLPL
ncbi:MAG: hypothetical protein M3P26_00250 [Gemmatimonadota bacterium]|nr:hypothetical protein [Gemmatimonadota bacterium]